jgi:Bacteriophage head to tail connecting protein
VAPARLTQTVFYRYLMSASAADMKWRKLWGKSPPKRVADALERAPYAQDIVFLHVVTPRGNVNPDEFGPGSMPWRSLHIEVEDRLLIDEGGYHEMPYMFPRDMVEAGEIYGRGAGMTVLPEMGTLNAQKRTFLQAGERVAAPPILMRDDAASLGARKINLTPWGVNGGMLDSRGNPLLRPFESGARLDMTREMMQDEIEAINDAFSLNLFRLLIEDPRNNVTAFEIAQRMQEKGELIGPAIDSLQSEIFGLETERIIGIMTRRGDLPEVPPIVAEAGTYRIQHTSPANQLQRAGEVAAITRAIQVVEPLAAIDPMVLKKFNAGKVIDRVMEIHGGPTEVLIPEEEFEQMMAAAQQQQQQAQQGAQLEQGAGAGKDIATALKLLQGGAAQGASAA